VYVIFRPADGDEQRYQFNPGKVTNMEAEAIERENRPHLPSLRGTATDELRTGDACAPVDAATPSASRAQVPRRHLRHGSDRRRSRTGRAVRPRVRPPSPTPASRRTNAPKFLAQIGEQMQRIGLDPETGGAGGKKRPRTATARVPPPRSRNSESTPSAPVISMSTSSTS